VLVEKEKNICRVREAVGKQLKTKVERRGRGRGRGGTRRRREVAAWLRLWRLQREKRRGKLKWSKSERWTLSLLSATAS
jgi:hypothetical protein